MEFIRGLHNIRPRHRGCVITMGTFDGVHHGHQMLLSHLSAKSKKLRVPSLLITFEPHPREFFQVSDVPARLTRFREKIDIFDKINIDRVLCIPFNERSRSISAGVIIERFLVERLGVKYLVIGDNFRFGCNAEGDYSMLKDAGERLNFDVGRVDTLLFDHERVSSTRIREALNRGDLVLAEKLLGRPYSMMGRVVYGKRLGTELGVPTANIRVARKRTAIEGIFTVTVTGLDRMYRGIASLGTRPTVDGTKHVIEVHLYDFSGDIYNEMLTVTFHKKMRDEWKFDSLDALKKQMQQDISESKSWFERNERSNS